MSSLIKFMKTNTKWVSQISSLSGSNQSGKLGKANDKADNWVKLRKNVKSHSSIS